MAASMGAIAASTVLTVTPAPPPPPPSSNSYTVFQNSATPTTPNINAGAPVELGLKFTADRSGYVTGVRFYKGSSNVGIHVGSLWSSTGQLLAQATFVNETASGWQQVNFAAPVAISANAVYLVSYHSPGYYSYDGAYFGGPVDSPPLHALSNAASYNGVYSWGANSTLPTLGAGGANFWVDVVFQ